VTAQAKIHRSLSFTEDTPLCNQNIRLPTELVTGDNNAVTCGSCKRSMKHSWGVDIDAPKPRKRNDMATKKKTTKKKSTKCAPKMTVTQKCKVFDQITPGALVDIKFSGIETFAIDYDGDIEMTHSGVLLPRSMLCGIANGEYHTFEADEEFGSEVNDALHSEGEAFSFSPADPCIYAIVITEHGTKTARVRLNSINETMVLKEGESEISIGCRSLTKKDAEAAATAIFKWLGYEVG